MDVNIFETQNDQDKNSKSLPDFILAAPYKNHSIKLTNLPKPVFTVIRNFEILRGRLLPWKLWGFQIFKTPTSIWLHWKRRCSATCWRFKNPILINIDQARALWTQRKGFFQSCQNIFWCLIFDDLSWTQFWR